MALRICDPPPDTTIDPGLKALVDHLNAAKLDFGRQFGQFGLVTPNGFNEARAVAIPARQLFVAAPVHVNLLFRLSYALAQLRVGQRSELAFRLNHESFLSTEMLPPTYGVL
jgi:hypothetical protein